MKERTCVTQESPGLLAPVLLALLLVMHVSKNAWGNIEHDYGSSTKIIATAL